MVDKNDNKKRCTRCNRELPLGDFYKNKRNSDGHTAQCKECIKKYYHNDDNKEQRKEYQKKYYQENKEKIKNYTKQYEETHIEYRRKKGQIKFNNNRTRGNGRITKAQWDECLLFFNNLCAYSGEEFDSSCRQDGVSMDHIVPVENGGCGFPWNIIPAKQSYNISKGTQNMYEWYVTQEKFSIIRLLKIEAWQKYAYNKWGYLVQDVV